MHLLSCFEIERTFEDIKEYYVIEIKFVRHSIL